MWIRTVSDITTVPKARFVSIIGSTLSSPAVQQDRSKAAMSAPFEKVRINRRRTHLVGVHGRSSRSRTGAASVSAEVRCSYSLRRPARRPKSLDRIGNDICGGEGTTSSQGPPPEHQHALYILHDGSTHYAGSDSPALSLQDFPIFWMKPGPSGSWS